LGTLLQKKSGAKHVQKLGAISDNFRLLSQISPKRTRYSKPEN